jgi:hypothetical protein
LLHLSGIPQLPISGAEYGFISTTRENLTVIKRHGRYYD